MSTTTVADTHRSAGAGRRGYRSMSSERLPHRSRRRGRSAPPAPGWPDVLGCGDRLGASCAARHRGRVGMVKVPRVTPCRRRASSACTPWRRRPPPVRAGRPRGRRPGRGDDLEQVLAHPVPARSRRAPGPDQQVRLRPRPPSRPAPCRGARSTHRITTRACSTCSSPAARASRVAGCASRSRPSRTPTRRRPGGLGLVRQPGRGRGGADLTAEVEVVGVRRDPGLQLRPAWPRAGQGGRVWAVSSGSIDHTDASATGRARHARRAVATLTGGGVSRSLSWVHSSTRHRQSQVLRTLVHRGSGHGRVTINGPFPQALEQRRNIAGTLESVTYQVRHELHLRRRPQAGKQRQPKRAVPVAGLSVATAKRPAGCRHQRPHRLWGSRQSSTATTDREPGSSARAGRRRTRVAGLSVATERPAGCGQPPPAHTTGSRRARPPTTATGASAVPRGALTEAAPTTAFASSWTWARWSVRGRTRRRSCRRPRCPRGERRTRPTA